MSDDTTSPSAHLSVKDMYSDYFLDYASYVILERAVPHLNDGLKPVQRRILHALERIDDGRYTKVANIVGDTMKYHPHGDASIGDAIVGIGQKGLLIDTQGNWGNVLTGDPAAAPRYIEARLTPFAKEVVFSPKITEWQLSYDGRNEEPVTLPVKFPLLLAQGAEGIAVGLACRMLPHNFNELIDASISALRGENFHILPDFLSGGLMDANDYRDGLRGGRIKVRARIEIVNNKLLRITEVPAGVTTGALMENIVAANEKGKIKVARLEDNTAANVDILIHLPPKSDPDTVVQALYAFTDCEVSISPNACVITEGKPRFIGASEMLRLSTLQTKDFLRQELEIKLAELREKWHFSSLEKIFIENRIYRDIEECETWQAVLDAIDAGLAPFKNQFHREITTDDLIRLTEIKIKRISKFDSFKADELIQSLNDQIEEVEKNLRNLTRFTIKYFQNLKKKYGKGRERKTEIVAEGFEQVNRAEVAVANEMLYVDRKNGFAGYGLKKEEAIEKCSTLDDIIVFTADGKMKVMKIAEKLFIGKRPIHVAVFRKDEDPIYNMIYRDGRKGALMVKRFQAGGVTRDKEYELTKGTLGTRIFHFSVHPSEEESNKQVLIIHLKPAMRLKKLSRPFHFAEVAIKGRAAKGNILIKHEVDRVVQAPKELSDDIIKDAETPKPTSEQPNLPGT